MLILFLSQHSLAGPRESVTLSSHDELYKLTETGTPVGKEYRLTTYLSPKGRRLVGGERVNFGNHELVEYDRGVRFQHEFMPGSDEVKKLYGLRGKQGCFTVFMAKDQVWLKAFHEGMCK